MAALKFGHERRGQRRFPLGGLGDGREVCRAASIRVAIRLLRLIVVVARVAPIQAAYLLAARLMMLLRVLRIRKVKLAAHML